MHVVILLVLPAILLAQGKIRGRLIDKETKESLVGANVVIVGTSYGAASDVNGEFSIIEVPVGTFTLRASFVGFSTMEIENIRVFNELTAEVNFDLQAKEIQMQIVTVVSERPLVNKSSTSAVRIVTTEDMQNAPVRGLNNIIALQPGIIVQDGYIHIRGGRPDEVGFYLEGASITDVHTGGKKVTLVEDALEEISVQSGGYLAEYGSANAGIIQHQLKTGGRAWKGTFDYVTDNVGLAGSSQHYSGNKRLGAYWYGYNEFTGTLGGPVLNERFRLFGMVNYNYQQDRNPQAYNGVDLGLVKDPASGDSVYVSYPAGLRLKNSSERYTYTGTFAMDFNPLLLRFSGSFAATTSFAGASLTQILNLDRIPETNTRDGFGSLKATYFLNPTSFVEISGGLFSWSQKQFDPILRDNFFAYGDSVANAEAGSVWIRRPGTPTGRYNAQVATRVYTFGFWAPGRPMSQYLKMNRSNIYFNVAFSTQIGKYNTVKVGGDYNRYTFRMYQISSPDLLTGQLADNASRPNSDPAKLTPEEVMIGWGVNCYGYDLFANEMNTSDFLGPRHPEYASAYMQDKLEFEDLVVNAGVRYDYINTKSFPLLDPYHPELTINKSTGAINPNGFRKSTPYSGVSPRLGAAFSVTDRTVFHVQFAQLVQQSRLRDVNLGMYAVNWMLISGGGGDPIGFDLQPTRTTQYEIGFSQRLGDFASFDLTGYFKDIKDEIVMRLLTPATGSPFRPYSVYENGDFGTTKGLELVFSMRRQKRIRLNATLSFQDAQGSGSFASSNAPIILGSGVDTAFVPQYVSPLSYNQAVRGNLNLDYRFEKGDGGPILEDLGASLLLTFNSGHPYTRYAPQSYGKPAEPLNTSTTPWTFQVDLRVDKTVQLFEYLRATVYLFVINVLNARNILNVYQETGSPDDDGWLSDPRTGARFAASYGEPYSDIYRALLEYNRPATGPPRQIRLGLRLEL